MPEGDTIHRAARTLQQALGGQVITRFESVFPKLARVDADTPIRGRTVERVRAEGKHLLMELSGDLTLRTHMRMNGSWHIYRRGERWMRPRSEMRIVLETTDWTAVGFSVPVAEFLSGEPERASVELRRLGPDVIAPEFDIDDAVRRVASHPDREIANVLLNQRVLAGIGNVYKSEVLFLAGIHPFAPVSVVGEEELRQLMETTRRLMVFNTIRPEAGRETRRGLKPVDRLWVYGRRGEPCRKCGTRIEMKKQGTDARVTYWCPRCQPA